MDNPNSLPTHDSHDEDVANTYPLSDSSNVLPFSEVEAHSTKIARALVEDTPPSPPVDPLESVDQARTQMYGSGTDIARIALLRAAHTELQANNSVKEHEAQAKKLHSEVESLKKQSITDPLTGALNRRGFHAATYRIVSRGIRNNFNSSLLIIDLDDFKQINSEGGHAAGDEALQTIVKTLNEQLRPQDAIGRWGGDEFIAALENTTPEEAAEIAERARKAVDDLRSKKSGIPSLSIGVAPIEKNIETTVKHADQAAYEAKEKGKNCVVVYDPNEQPAPIEKAS